MASPENEPVSCDVPNGQEFIRLYVSHERRIYSYILTLVHDWSASEDILQETAKVMWLKFSQFEPGTNFVAWAFTVARYQVMNFQKRRNMRIVFDSELMTLLDQEIQCLQDVESREHEALKRCLKKLAQRDRRLIELRYSTGATVRSVAARLGRGMNAIYQSLNRIHDQLLQCIQRSLAREHHL